MSVLLITSCELPQPDEPSVYVLAYVGSAPCAPCQYSEQDFKCITTEQDQLLRQSRLEKWGMILCERCLELEKTLSNYECVCEGKNCYAKLKASMPNPASEYCLEQGNKFMIITDNDGSQRGVCVLNDGTECDEWQYFRGECPASQEYAVVKIQNVKCNYDSECEVPMYYSVQSSCPYTTKCIEKKCTVICPGIIQDDYDRTHNVNDADKQCEQCPIYSPPDCRGARMITEIDECGCRVPKCEPCNTCPTYSPPAPDFCKDGTIIDQGEDECGCSLPPKCWVQKSCGNGICEDGEAEQCPECYYSEPPCLAPCILGTCPQDCEEPDTQQNVCSDPRPEACTKEYTPVCGWFDERIMCFRYPCAVNYDNGCEACANPTVAYWTQGPCPTEHNWTDVS